MSLKESLSERLGPLPRWGWGVAVVGGLGAAYVIHRRGIGGGAPSLSTNVPTPQTRPGSGGGALVPGGSTGTAAQTAPSNTTDTNAIVAAVTAAVRGIVTGVQGTPPTGTSVGAPGEWKNLPMPSVPPSTLVPPAQITSPKLTRSHIDIASATGEPESVASGQYGISPASDIFATLREQLAPGQPIANDQGVPTGATK